MRKQFFLYLIFVNSVIFLIFYASYLFSGSNPLLYLRFGAQFGPIVSSDQWYRIVTAMFMHGGVLHLLFNMYALYILGNYVESIYGSYRFLVFYLSTGIIGNIATHLFYYNSISVGASGAIFGLVGVLFLAGFRKDTPFFLKSVTGSALLPMIIFNIVLGFIPGTGINNAAHIGGLLSGMLFGYIFPVYDNYRFRNVWRILAYVLIGVVVLSFLGLIYFNLFGR